MGFAEDATDEVKKMTFNLIQVLGKIITLLETGGFYQMVEEL